MHTYTGQSDSNYCKRLNFHEDLIFANFANCLRFAKNRSREQFGHMCQHYGSYIRFAKIRTREFQISNWPKVANFKFPALGQFG
ncbi:MAG: hypothetical protein PV344_03350 [Anaplasma sp.]|nr:hypothetical protein [Anaplasma sp.]